ncbi:GumC family protein [Desulfogranum japonicum]|uniref:GumC family protein n=1 Tax=Desulfogranum japonicum TaxID=231447 RepID=UPI0004056EEA|nr:polysaccharide biosynthesis tyrosine autokinase [Desulfogranum japonicum]
MQRIVEDIRVIPVWLTGGIGRKMENNNEIMFEEREIHLRSYLRVLEKRKSIIIAFFVITVLVVTIATLRMVPIYQASTQVLVEKNESTSLMGNGYYNVYDPEFYETQHQLIKSQNVARKVVQLLNLTETYATYFPNQEENASFVRTMKDTVKGWMAALKPSSDDAIAAPGKVVEEKSRESILADMVQDGIVVSPVQESKLLNISFQSENPYYSKVVADTIAEAYKEEIMAIHMNSSGYALQWMTKKAEEEKEKLTQSEIALQAYMKQQNIVTVEDKVSIVPQKLTNLTNQLAEAQTNRSNLENIYKKVQQAKQNGGDLESLLLANKSGGLVEIRLAIRKAEQQIVELSQKYGYKHPVMIDAKSQLKDLQRQKKSEMDKIVASIKNEYDVATGQETAIKEALAEGKQEAMGLNERLMEYNRLKREVDANRALYEALMMQAKEKDLTENTQKVNVWLTQEAELPESPIKPNVKRNLLLGLMLGVFGGVGMAFFIEYLDNTIKDPEDTERRFGHTVIGVVEMLAKEDPDTFARLDGTTSFAESFKSLRTALLLSSADQPPKRVQMTSMSPKEGKTTNAVNLAFAVAQTERSVVLIDTDLRRPRLHKALRVKNDNGLSSYLSGAHDTIDIQKVPETNVSVICAGPIPPNPSELLDTQRFGEMLDQLSQQYDMIIIDSPPVLSATDALIVSKHVDGVVVVTRFAETTFERLNRGLKSLKDIDSRIIGLVINCMDMKKSNYYSYYGYYQYYSAGKEEQA